MFSLFPRSLIGLLVLGVAATAHAAPCTDLYTSATQAENALERAIKEIDERLPQTTIYEEAEKRTINPDDEALVHPLLKERQEQKLMAADQYTALLPRLQPIQATWNEAVTECDADASRSPEDDAMNRTFAKVVRESRDGLMGKYGLSARIKEKSARARCKAAEETIYYRTHLLTQGYEKNGYSEEAYKLAVGWALLQVEERKRELASICGELGESEYSGLVKDIKELNSAFLLPYTVFISLPRSSSPLGNHEEQFAGVAVYEASEGHLPSIDALLTRGNYKLPLRAADGGVTLLMATTDSGNVKLARYLVEFGKKNPDRGSLDANARDEEGNTALHYCALSPKCTPEFAELLINELKTDKKRKNKEDLTALDIAKELRRSRLIPLLQN